jgi:hypothetical protein
MQKKIQLPKEHLIEPEEAAARHLIDENDVEGHVVPPTPESLMRRLPSTGGEIVEDDDQSPNGVGAR